MSSTITYDAAVFQTITADNAGRPTDIWRQNDELLSCYLVVRFPQESFKTGINLLQSLIKHYKSSKTLNNLVLIAEFSQNIRLLDTLAVVMEVY